MKQTYKHKKGRVNHFVQAACCIGSLIALDCGALEQMEPAAVQRAEMNYLLNCASCHQVNGKGTPGSVPGLDEYLGKFAQHPATRAFPAQVPGATGAPISDKELADVLNWILYTMNRAQLRQDFKPYSAEEVGEYRQTPVLDIEKTRKALIREVVGNYSD